MSTRMRQLAGERGRDGTRDAPPPTADEPRRLRYPRRQLHGDLVRGLIGLVLTAGPLIAVRPLLAVAIVLGLCAAIFAIYLARTLARYRVWLDLDGAGVHRRGLGRWLGPWGDAAIAWDGLETVKLRYYTTKRGREGAGWLVLTLTGRDSGGASGRTAKISVESTLEGFDDLLARTAATVVARGLSPDETSQHNFAAAGRPLVAPRASSDAGADGRNGEERGP